MPSGATTVPKAMRWLETIVKLHHQSKASGDDGSIATTTIAASIKPCI